MKKITILLAIILCLSGCNSLKVDMNRDEDTIKKVVNDNSIIINDNNQNGFDTIDTQNLEIIDKKIVNKVELIGQLIDHKGCVFDADISHDSTKIASSERGDIIKVNIWDIATESVMQSFEIDQAVMEFEFSNDDRYLLCRGEKGDLLIWDLLNNKMQFNSGDIEEMVLSMDMSSDNKLLVTGNKGEMKVWDFETMKILQEASFDDEYITQAVFSPDDSMIAYAYAGGTEDFTAHVLNAGDLSELYKTDGHTKYNYTLLFADNLRVLVSCSGDNLIKLWDANDGNHIRTLSGHTGKVMDVDFSLNEDLIISGSAHDKTVRIWDIITGEQIKKLIPGGEVQSVEVADNGKFFISAGESGTISIWGVNSN